MKRVAWRSLAGDTRAASLALLGSVLLNYPGYVYDDTLLQLRFAKVLRHSGPPEIVYDLHPIIMSLVFAVLEFIGNPVGLLLMIHQAMFWGGLWLLGRAFFPNTVRTRTWMILLIGLYPPILGVSGGVLKDLAMLSGLTFCSGLVLWLRRQPPDRPYRRWLWAIAAAVFFYAVNVRVNAIFAALPMLFLFDPRWIAPATAWTLRAFVKPAVRWLAALALIVVSHKVLTRPILGVQNGYLVQQLYLQDIVSISLKTGQNLVPDQFFWEPPGNLEKLRKLYDPSSCMYLFALKPIPELLKETRDHAQMDSLKALWISSIQTHPWEYLAGRLEVLTRYYHLPGHQVCWPIFRGSAGNTYDIRSPSNFVHRTVYDGLEAISQSIFYRGFVYLLGALAIVGAWFGLKFGLLGLRRRPGLTLVPITFAISGLCYSSSSLVIGLACDFRYHIWSIMAVLLAVAALTSELRSEAPEKS